jgi:hypothetical protein
MRLFLELEAGYLAIAIFILVVTIIVSTRSFVAKNAWRKAIPLMFLILGVFIGSHYYITTNRIYEVENTFNKHDKIICENRAIRKISQSVIIEKSNEWTLENHMLSSPNYSRDFFTARCIKYVPVSLEEIK